MNKYFLIFNKHNENRHPSLMKDIKENLCLVENIDEADYILVAGGDGSLLQAIQSYYTYHIPFVGINAGTLGYYMHDVDNNKEKVKAFNTAQFEIIECPMLSFTVESIDGKIFSGNAFADLWIKADKSAMIYNLCVSDDIVSYCSDANLKIYGDGILLSTPVGSTGYSHNLGGSIFPFNVPIYQVVPMSSAVNKKTIRSFPVSIDSEIDVSFINADYRSGRFFFDGFMLNDIKGYETFKPNRLKVKKSNHKVELGFLSIREFREKSFSWLY